MTSATSMTSMTSMSHTGLARATTLLFVPATRPDRLPKALASGAGGVIVDLEDAVTPAQKEGARAALAQAVAALAPALRGQVLLRVNAAGTHWHAGDLALAGRLVAKGLAGVVLPKAESAAILAAVAQAAGAAAALVPLIESAAGLDAVDALARSPQVLRLGFGHLDFQADLGLDCGPDEAELIPARMALAMATRRAGIAAPLDGITAATGDLARLRADAARSRRAGFGGKLCIHPDQVAPVRAAFEPSPAELDWARRVVAGAAGHAGAVFRLDGRMVDAPVIRLAQRTLALAPANRQTGHTA